MTALAAVGLAGRCDDDGLMPARCQLIGDLDHGVDDSVHRRSERLCNQRNAHGLTIAKLGDTMPCSTRPPDEQLISSTIRPKHARPVQSGLQLAGTVADRGYGYGMPMPRRASVDDFFAQLND